VLRRTPSFLVLSEESPVLCCCVDFVWRQKRRQELVVRIMRNIVPVFHVICTPHQPGTTHFRYESIEMINARGLPIASGFMVFDFAKRVGCYGHRRARLANK